MLVWLDSIFFIASSVSASLNHPRVDYDVIVSTLKYCVFEDILKYFRMNRLCLERIHETTNKRKIVTADKKMKKKTKTICSGILKTTGSFCS